MKKFTLFILLLTAIGANAQQLIAPIQAFHGKPDYPAQPFYMKYFGSHSSGAYKSESVSGWYSYTEALADSAKNIFVGNSFNQTTYIDTIVKIVSKDATTGAVTSSFEFTNSVGAMFDPSDTIFQYQQNAGFRSSTADTNVRPLARVETYTIDSILFPYNYVRNVDSMTKDSSSYKDSNFYAGTWHDTINVKKIRKLVVDTLILQISRVHGKNFWGLGTNGQVGATFLYNRFTGLADSMDQTIKIPLTSKDTTTLFYTNKVFQYPIGVTGGIIGAVFTYKSGLPVNFGDTLKVYGAPTIIPKKQLNPFTFLLRVETKRPFIRYNNGLVVDSKQRYDSVWTQSTSNVSPRYIISTWHPDMFFKVTHDYEAAQAPSGINDIKFNNGYALGDLYPNPVNGGTSNLEFALGKSGNVTIELFNMLGQKVNTVTSGIFSSGIHKISVNTQGMKPGMYFYTINADGFTQTKKFTVAE